jgi:hypothetical protein
VAKRYACGVVVAVAVLAAGAIGVGRAQAGLLPCSYPNISQPFAQWGDFRHYYLQPGGDFEGWSTPWRLSGGAKITGGNESFYVNGPTDSRSLLIPAGASATGPSSCIWGLTDLSLRMFAKSSDGSALRVDVMVPALFGILRTAKTFYVGTSTDWQPTESVFNLLNVLSLTNLGTANISLRISSPSGASFQVDDVYIDPKFWI